MYHMSSQQSNQFFAYTRLRRMALNINLRNPRPLSALGRNSPPKNNPLSPSKQRSNQVAASAYQPPESSAGATAEQISLSATLHDSNSGRSSDNSLRALLESLAGSVTALGGFPAQETATATVASSWKFGGRQRSSTSLNSVRGAAFSSQSQAEATKDVLLAVSVVATLDAGGAFREENAALLEVSRENEMAIV